jgi:hypothetical protein
MVAFPSCINHYRTYENLCHKTPRLHGLRLIMPAPKLFDISQYFEAEKSEGVNS